MHLSAPALFRRPLLILLPLALATRYAWAKQPDGGPPGKGKHPRPVEDLPVGAYFQDRQRQAASDYYRRKRPSGHCPPGLAKKNNGCLPPGQARKWQRGQPLATSVVWYPVPRELVTVIGTPPPGYRYVRVLNDILLIAIGSRIVIDAIEDLMR